MEPEDRLLLKRTFAIAEENNRILRSLRRAQRFAIATRILYWVLIIGLAFGAFYFIQPYLETLVSALGQAQGTVSNLNGVLGQVKDVIGK